MSSAWQNALREAWAELGHHPVQNRQFRTRRLSTDLALDAYAALRAADDAPCLLIEAPARALAMFEVGGMRLSVVAGERNPLIVLALEDHDRLDLFTTVCADAVSAAAAANTTDALTHFLVRLDAWRRFLRDRRSGMSREEAIGLIGELVILENILATNMDALACWLAPDDGLHDFLRDGHAVEIKTSLGPSSTIHISSLDQLDAAGLRRLDLLHIRLIEAPDGRSLESLIEDIALRLPDETSRRAFENALLRRGLMPDDVAARSRPLIQLRDIDAYGVNGSFPRLSRSAVPSAVADAVYSLELRAIAAHAVDSTEVLRNFAGGAAT